MYCTLFSWCAVNVFFSLVTRLHPAFQHLSHATYIEKLPVLIEFVAPTKQLCWRFLCASVWAMVVAFLHLLSLVVVLTEVDQLTRDAQHALRRTMEKYMATCRIILCCNSTSKVIPAIRSRCLGVRVAAPKIEEVSTIMPSLCRPFAVNSSNQEWKKWGGEGVMKLADC